MSRWRTLSNEPCIVVLTAPSGSGKTTIASRLLQAIDGMRFSISATTREPRQHEEDGIHYHFLSQDQFDREKEAGRLVEYEEVYPGCSYGTLMSEVERSSAECPVLLDIDVKGAANVKRLYGNLALVIFVCPPSIEVLEERLRNRKTESDDAFRVRLERAEMELTFQDRFDHKIVNDVLDVAVEQTVEIVSNFLSRAPLGGDE